MSTKQTARIYLKNNMGGSGFFQLSHRYSGNKPEVGNWFIAQGQTTTEPLVVNFETGFGTGFDYWYCSASITTGGNAGIYVTSGSLLDPSKECMLEDGDANQSITLVIDTSTFHINLPSGGCSTGVTKLQSITPKTGSYPPPLITNVFMLMLENHSFDHLFGYSSYNSVNTNKLTGNESNTYQGTTYPVAEGAVDPMPLGPGHEFMNTLTHLCGQGTQNPFPTGPYPAINNSGFVADYAAEGASSSALGDVMHCCNPSQIPNLYKLAQNFVLCDNWFSSMPGPTWPNRLFAMGGSSAGLDDSPSSSQILEWETVSGFTYQHGSIFDLLKNSGHNYRLYNDFDNTFVPGHPHFTGKFPIVAGLHNIQITDVNPFYHMYVDSQTGATTVTGLAADLQRAYPYQFTWIEPNYGDADGDFSGGSSQHPTDSLTAGEKLIAATYDAIRTSPYWWTSVLIITYDEHGGYYDHVAPPAATPPGDTQTAGLNTHGFDFSRYGVRVPAVVVSPLTVGGVISKQLYDHTSVLATLEHIWNMSSLTNRDAGANNFMNLFETISSPRTNTPIALTPNTISGSLITSDVAAESLIVEPAAAETVESAAPPAARKTKSASHPLPERGNIIGLLHVALKAEIELSDGSDATKQAIIDNFKATVHTYGDANAYFEKVARAVEVARAARQSSSQS